MGIQRREIAISIILSIVTCGIYSYYWIYCMSNDANIVAEESGTSGGMVVLLSIVTCGIYMWYWLYVLGGKLATAKAKRGMPADNNLGLIYVILGVVGLSIVSLALAQNELNQMAA